MISAKLVLGVFLFAAAMGANAQSVYPPNTSIAYLINNNLDKIYPYRGAYYDPSKPGTGLLLDLGSSGNAFVSYYDYTSTGAPMWYYLSGTYQPSDEATRWTTGVIGTLSGKFTLVTDGQCLGCNYTPTTETPTDIPVTMVWTNSREVKLTIGNQTWDMTAPNFDGHADGGILTGVWAVAFTYATDFGSSAAGTTITTVAMQPITIPVVVDPAAANWTAFKPGYQAWLGKCGDTQHTYSYYSIFFTTCGNLEQSLGGARDYSSIEHPVFWYDPQSNKFGMDMAHLTTVNGARSFVIGNNGEFKNNLHFDLYMQGTNALSGRSIFEGQQIPDGYKPGAMRAVLSMVKLPGNNVVIP